MAGFRLTQKKAMTWSRESATGLLIGRIFFRPRRGVSQARVDGSNILYAIGFQPFLEGFRAATGKAADAVLPSGASTEDAAKMHACFGGKLQGFVEHAIAHACGEKQKRLRRYFRGTTKKPQGVCAAVNEPAVTSRGALNVSHSYGHSHLQNIGSVLGFRELLHGIHQDIRLAARKFEASLIHARLVGNDFKEKRDVAAGAFRADVFNPGTFTLPDFRSIGESIVQQDFDAMSASIDQAGHGPALQQAGKTAGNVGVVAAYFVSHQEAGGWSALTGCTQTVFRLKKHGAGVRRKRAHDDGFEFFELFAWNGRFLDFEFSREQGSQRVALVDGKSTNDSAGIRNGFEPLALARRKLHSDPPVESCVQPTSCRLRKKGRTGV